MFNLSQHGLEALGPTPLEVDTSLCRGRGETAAISQKLTAEAGPSRSSISLRSVILFAMGARHVCRSVSLNKRWPPGFHSQAAVVFFPIFIPESPAPGNTHIVDFSQSSRGAVSNGIH